MPNEQPAPQAANADDELAHPPQTRVDPPPSEETTKVRLTVAHSEADGVQGAAGDVVEVPADQAERMIAAGTAEPVGAGAERQQSSTASAPSTSSTASAGPSGPVRRVGAGEEDDDKDDETPRVPRRR